MVCYCPERRILYIHLPKCAGITIESVLIKKYGFKHFSFPDSNDQYKFLRDPRGKMGIFKYILKYSNEAKIYDLTSFRKFTIVRNPYKKAESAIRYLHKSYVKRSIKQIGEMMEMKNRKSLFPLGIDFFYRFALIDDYYYMHFCLSQSKSLEDLNGNIDFTIGKFENLMPELRRILFDQYGLEPFEIENVHANKSIKELLNFDVNNVNKIVKSIHIDDFNNFGYDIEEPIKRINVIDEILESEEKEKKKEKEEYKFIDEFADDETDMIICNPQVEKISEDV